MSVAEALVPEDSFRVRIAIIRAEKGWNYEDAEAATGVSAQNWRLWEKIGRKPRDYEQVCGDIARGSGYSRTWISDGGPLRRTCFAPLSLLPDLLGQTQFAFDEPAALALA